MTALGDEAVKAHAVGNAKKLFSIINQLAPRTRRPKLAIKGPDGEWCFDSAQELEAWAERVETLFQAKRINEPEMEETMHFTDVFHQIDHILDSLKNITEAPDLDDSSSS